jgi:geranylgeranyl pyrophosphate synthase
MTELPYSRDLSADRERIEQELGELLRDSACREAGPVQKAMHYAVMGQGQRIRPLLALRMARLLEGDETLTLRAACAVEMLHCASLIIDDLPCMDNDAERRGRPSVHIQWGEATAILAAFALVALSARLVVDQDCPAGLRDRRRAFQIALLKTLDCSGLIGGQSLDLSLAGDVRESNRIHMHELKTVPLFDLAVRAGLTFTTAEPGDDLRRFGREFGIAFQIADDWADGEIDDPLVVETQLQSARGCLAGYGAGAAPLHQLIDYLHARSFANHHSHR